MDHDKVAEALHQAAGVLMDLANELQENVGSVGHEILAEQIQTLWHGVKPSAQLSIGPINIDLSTKEGKWDLLVIALLKGARVTEEVVEATFRRLKDEDLLNPERLLTEDSGIRKPIRLIFESTYKALGHRQAKVDALFYNARLLHSTWGGDLQNLYESVSGDDQLIRGLQQFRQISRMAVWICRTMYIHGIWPKVGLHARGYVDWLVRLPLQRLGMVESMDSASGFRYSVEEVEHVIKKWFAGDVVSLYLHGANLCVKDDPDVCLAKCPVADRCSFPNR